MESYSERLESGIESLRADVVRLCSNFQILRTIPTPAKVEVDTPQPQFVENAPDLLVHMHVLKKASSKGSNELTHYGRLLLIPLIVN